MKKAILSVLVLGFVVTLMGCETIKGIGRDLANTGENIHDAATGTGGTK